MNVLFPIFAAKSKYTLSIVKRSAPHILRLLALALYFIDIHDPLRYRHKDSSALSNKVRKCAPLETLTQSTSLT